jgi:predicted nucleic acid-binding protein
LNSLTLVDTSAWTHALRRNGDLAVRQRVEQLLSQNAAALCDPVRLELWNGVRGDAERVRLRAIEAALPRLDITGEVWTLSCDCAEKARAAGITTPAIDVLIFACARYHGVSIEHADRHFELLAKL